jgi:VCBS repeat-containing protein
MQAQVRPDETLITPVPCTPRITSNHAAGDEAARVTVTMEETCTGETYATQALHAQVLRVVTQQATAQLGTGYTLTGDIQATVRQSRSSTNQQDGPLALQVSGTGTWAYQFDDARLQHMAQLVAGKSRQQAAQILLHLPGVNQVSMTISGTDSSNVPADASRIHLLVLYRSA